MGMTITEKILAAHAGKDFVEPGEIIDAKIDLALANDITAPLSLEEFEKVGAKRVFDPEHADHFLKYSLHSPSHKEVGIGKQCIIVGKVSIMISSDQQLLKIGGAAAVMTQDKDGRLCYNCPSYLPFKDQVL